MTFTLPSRENTTVRVADPRTKCSEVFESPIVNPSGENVTCRAGPARDTWKAEGPASAQSARIPERGVMVSAAESMVSVSTTPRAMAMIRAR